MSKNLEKASVVVNFKSTGYGVGIWSVGMELSRFKTTLRCKLKNRTGIIC